MAASNINSNSVLDDDDSALVMSVLPDDIVRLCKLVSEDDLYYKKHGKQRSLADCNYMELEAAINWCEIEGEITRTEAHILRKKYLE